jgi:hypothetical protein
MSHIRNMNPPPTIRSSLNGTCAFRGSYFRHSQHLHDFCFVSTATVMHNTRLLSFQLPITLSHNVPVRFRTIQECESQSPSSFPGFHRIAIRHLFSTTLLTNSPIGPFIHRLKYQYASLSGSYALKMFRQSFILSFKSVFFCLWNLLS